ncbi:hypothetical protein IEQ34_021215 [Dendrobium chrysotoxum]|uniref:DUF4283 domain-containing protein n=1 Tax=Dendrobium chrysotoxum TaxID=161865 RepID=A0AAV7G4B4_DENCH|nr:hypothetical protein IEQ34_021215 [Dendrobium chrysotoxum]
MDSIRKNFFNLKLSGDFSVTLLDPMHVLIKLTNDMDYNRVFAHHSDFFNHCFMKIIKWSPFFLTFLWNPPSSYLGFFS